jgi:hypothetical protein
MRPCTLTLWMFINKTKSTVNDIECHPECVIVSTIHLSITTDSSRCKRRECVTVTSFLNSQRKLERCAIRSRNLALITLLNKFFLLCYFNCLLETDFGENSIMLSTETLTLFLHFKQFRACNLYNISRYFS